MHVDDIKNILKLLGVAEDGSNHNQHIENILKEQTRFSTLNWEEFLEFMRRFKALMSLKT